MSNSDRHSGAPDNLPDGPPSGGAGESPFVFASLERRTGDYLTQIREQARRIAKQTTEEIAEYRRQAEEDLAATEQMLNTLQAQLDAREEALRQRETRLDDQAYEQNYQHGYAEGKEEGHRAGYADGMAQAKQQAEAAGEQQIEREIAPLCSAFTQLVGQLSQTRLQLLKNWESNALQIAAAIAHQAIGRELSQVPDLPLSLLREALELAVGSTTVKIRMNPDDLKLLRPRVDALLTEFAAMTRVDIQPDERIHPGGCVVETPQGIVDQRIESRLERIITELSS